MDQGFFTSEGRFSYGALQAAAISGRAGAHMIVVATRERVGNSRRTIAQSRQLVNRTRQTLEYSKTLRLRRMAVRK